MNTKIALAVYRDGPRDQSPQACQLQRLRAQALHDALEDEPAWHVSKWGTTDDTTAHELVELVIALAANPAVQAAALPALKAVGGVILKAALGAAASEGVKLIIARLVPKQQQNQIAAFSISLPDGTMISCEPGAAQPTLRISTKGQDHRIPYNATENDIPAGLQP
jgi:hypothetical protein